MPAKRIDSIHGNGIPANNHDRQKKKQSLARRVDGLNYVQNHKKNTIPLALKSADGGLEIRIPKQAAAIVSKIAEKLFPIKNRASTAEGMVRPKEKNGKSLKKRFLALQRKHKKKLRKNIITLKIKLKSFLRLLLIISAWGIISVAAVYLIYAGALLRLNFSKRSLLPVPAVISNKGVISYNEYIRVAGGLRTSDALEKNLKNLVKTAFIKLYGLPASASETELDNTVAKDEGINEAALARINKIKDEIIKLGFEDVYRKYGDEYNDGEYITRDQAMAKFHNSLIDYGGDKISPVLYGDRGYYIVEVVDNRSEPIGIKYVFVKAELYNEYEKEAVKSLKVWKLIK